MEQLELVAQTMVMQFVQVVISVTVWTEIPAIWTVVLVAMVMERLEQVAQWMEALFAVHVILDII